MVLPLEMRLGRDIAEELEQKGMVVFEDKNGQSYALFKLEDKKGAVVSFNSNMHTVYTVKKEDEQ